MIDYLKHLFSPIRITPSADDIAGGRIDLLDVIKAVAILFVIFTHIPMTLTWDRPVIYPLLIDQAVPVFIILMGYCHMFSLANKENNAWSGLGKRIIRFMSPYLAVLAAEVVIIAAAGIMKTGVSGGALLALFKKIAYYLLCYGGYGPGSFFVPVLIQLCFIVPFLSMLSTRKMLAFAFVFNLIFEVLSHRFGISPLLYRLMAFRYVFLAATGIYLFDCRKEQKGPPPWLLVVSAAMGIAYIFLLKFAYHANAVKAYWMNTNMFVAFYVFPVMYFLICRFERIVHWNSDNVFGKIGCFAGRNSYQVYLGQMLFFFMAGVFGTLVKRRFFSGSSGKELIYDILIAIVSFPISLLFGFFLLHMDSVTKKYSANGIVFLEKKKRGEDEN